MSAGARLSDVMAGDDIAAQSYRVTRETLVRYAGASGDFNVIHWSHRHALEVGLPDVIAHGNFTMALAARYLVTWAGDPGALQEYGVRFARPLVVPDTDEGATVEIVGRVVEVLDDGLVRVDLTVTNHGQKVLTQARAKVRLR